MLYMKSLEAPVRSRSKQNPPIGTVKSPGTPRTPPFVSGGSEAACAGVRDVLTPSQPAAHKAPWE